MTFFLYDKSTYILLVDLCVHMDQSSLISTTTILISTVRTALKERALSFPISEKMAMKLEMTDVLTNFRLGMCTEVFY